jgi:transposase
LAARRLRPRRPTEAFLRRSVLAGQEAQVDWAHFGKLTVGRAQRDLWAFVMVLSYSRFRFLRRCTWAAIRGSSSGHARISRRAARQALAGLVAPIRRDAAPPQKVSGRAGGQGLTVRPSVSPSIAITVWSRVFAMRTSSPARW